MESVFLRSSVQPEVSRRLWGPGLGSDQLESQPMSWKQVLPAHTDPATCLGLRAEAVTDGCRRLENSDTAQTSGDSQSIRDGLVPVSQSKLRAIPDAPGC